MTEEFSAGLGALPSPPDPRDYQISLAAPAVPLPSRWVSSGMGPVLNQGKTPQCVAYAHAGLKTWEEKRDKHGVITFATDWFYRQCKAIDGIDGDGTDGRSAMKVLRNIGYAPASAPSLHAAYGYRISAYYAVPLTLDAIKNAVYTYGPVTVGGRWFNSWFKPKGGIIPAPGGGVAGGHAVLVFGWDDSVAGGSLLVRNSWGNYPGSVNGNFYAPVRYYLPELWEAWKALDLANTPAL